MVKFRRGNVIVDSECNNGKSHRYKLLRVDMECGTARHILHIGGKSCGAPVEKSCLMVTKRSNRSDANNFKSQLSGSVFNLCNLRRHKERLRKVDKKGKGGAGCCRY